MKLIPIVVLTFFFSFSFVFAETVQAPVPLEAPGSPVEAPKTTSKEKVLLIFKDPRMVKVLTCESGLKQFRKDGKPIISPTSDVGIAQINKYHWKRAKNLGLDIFNNEDDNLKMAKIIYDEQGIDAWSAFENACYFKTKV